MNTRITKYALKALLFVAVLFLIVWTFATTAYAQGYRNCAQREIVLERLADKYGETQQSVGLSANDIMVEVYASTESGSWTIITTDANKMTCIAASGQSFEVVTEQLAQGDPT